MRVRLWLFAIGVVFSVLVSVTGQPARRALTPQDILRFANVADPQISPNGDWVVYTVTTTDSDQTISTLWIVRAGPTIAPAVRPVSPGQPTRFPEGRELANPPTQLLPAGWRASNPRWSPDGRSIAFLSRRDDQNGIWVVNFTRGSSREIREPRLVANVQSTNFHIAYAGETFAWSPDSKRIAYITATEEGDPAERSDDPRVIDRIQYKSRTAFSDNRRTHVWLVEVARPEPRQLTSGAFYDHAVAFSPRGDEIAFLSNHERDPDANNNSDIFAVDFSGQVRQLTDTSGCEYEPVWSPDGRWLAYTATKRRITTIDSVAEDTHVWVIAAAGGGGRELTAKLDRRARNPRWSGNSREIFFLAGDKGQTKLFVVPADGETAREVFTRIDNPPNPDSAPFEFAGRTFHVSGFSVSAQTAARHAMVLSDPVHPGEIFIAPASPDRLMQRLTRHNSNFVSGVDLVFPDELAFRSFDGTTIQAWLMKPVGWRSDRRYPMILSIHGGPHGMYGVGFSATFQVYAARGYAVLFLNPRGSSGYGQKFSDGTLNEWGGGDFKDLMYGVDEALRRYSWIDQNRMGVTGGSYGGYMTNWIITQTPRFKAAVASASVSNLISFYSTSLYQDLIHAEFGGFPWDNYELLWQWSPLRYVRYAQTPTLFLHGELDNDVHITQAEEMYMALKRRGVETVFVRYPREGHGLREPKHRVDALERTLAWFDRFLK